MDLDGNIIDPGSTQLGVNKAGYVIHSAIHAARKDVKCIVHLHTCAGAAVRNYNKLFVLHITFCLGVCHGVWTATNLTGCIASK